MLDIQAEQQESGQPYQELYEAVASLKRRHHLATSALRPRDGLALRIESERESVQELVARFRRLPDDARRKLPALWNSLAQLEIVIGDLEAGQRDFGEVAGLVRDPRWRAEAHHNVYRTALERRDWDSALAALRKAVALDSAVFEPFPWSRYEPRRILGAGGFGVSFSCHDRQTNEDVVIKALRSDSLDRPDGLIFRECRILQDLEQPTLVRIHDAAYAGKESSRPYLVLEHVDATPLDEYVATHGRIDPEEWLEICWPLARTLQAMHNRNVLHRSLRPACVLLRYTKTREGARRPIVKLADATLGVRRAFLHASASNPEATTQTGMGRSVARMIGYLPPETIGRPKGHVWIGPHSDIFGLGRLSLFALTGRPDAGPGEKLLLPEPWHKLLDACTAWTINRRPANMSIVIDRLTALAPEGFVHRLERDQQEAAINSLTTTLIDEPANVSARTQRGTAYFQQGEFSQAIADLTEALRQAPNDASLYRHRAQARQRLSDVAGAILDWTESLRIEPRSIEALTNRGLCQAQKGEHDLAIVDYSEGLKINPRDEGLFGNRGNAYYIKGDLERAIADYSQVIRLDPRNVQALGNRGRAFLFRGEVSRAVDDFTRLLQLAPGHLKALADRAGAFMDLGKPDRAIADYSEAIRLQPSASLFHDRGIAHAVAGKLDAAVADFTEALALNPENVASLLSRGDALARQDQLGAALADFGEAMRLEPRSPTAHLRRAHILARLERFDEALADLSAVMKIDPQGSAAYLQRGRLYADRHEHALAIADFTEVIHLDPRAISAFIRRADCYTQLGELVNALADYDQALNFDPTNVQALSARAEVRLRVGQADGALNDFTELIRQNPQNPETFRIRGLLLASQGEHDRALSDLDQAIRLCPESAALYAHRGNLRAARGELERAIADLAESSRLDAQDATTWFNLANCRLEKGQPREALADLERALALRPDHAPSLVNRAIAQQRLGDLDAALADFTAAIALDSTSVPALLGRAALLAGQGKTADALIDLSRLQGTGSNDVAVCLLQAEIHQSRSEYEPALAALTTALEHAPDDPQVLNNLACLLASCPNESLQNPARAIELARKACQIEETPCRLDTLATALAAARQWDEAIRVQEQAIDQAPRSEQDSLRAHLRELIAARVAGGSE